jgi:hypothetical protein
MVVLLSNVAMAMLLSNSPWWCCYVMLRSLGGSIKFYYHGEVKYCCHCDIINY